MRRHYITISILFWLALVFASAVWNISQIRSAQRQADIQVGRAFFEMIVTVREWNSQLGGLYVPVSEHIQPNPYLQDADRDLRLDNGLVLTKINPAYMTRLIAELAEKGNQIRFHITSLKPINPNNVADSWESHALYSFEQQQINEAYTWDTQNIPTFRYMAPLITKESCLKCHAVQGYQVGDIRGGISVSFASRPVVIWPIIVSHVVIGLVGLAALVYFGRHLQQTFLDLERQSQFDSLTQVYNRRYFDAYLHREFLRSRREQTPLSIILCDVDYFKTYNDIYGHQMGDQCLRQLGMALAATIKRPGDIVARYGGEEFVIVLPHTSTEGAYAIAELVRANVESLNILHKGNQVSDHITLSCGVATSHGEIRASMLLERADQALYQAKQTGKNMVVCALDPYRVLSAGKIDDDDDV